MEDGERADRAQSARDRAEEIGERLKRLRAGEGVEADDVVLAQGSGHVRSPSAVARGDSVASTLPG